MKKLLLLASMLVIGLALSSCSTQPTVEELLEMEEKELAKDGGETFIKVHEKFMQRVKELKAQSDALIESGQPMPEELQLTQEEIMNKARKLSEKAYSLEPHMTEEEYKKFEELLHENLRSAMK